LASCSTEGWLATLDSIGKLAALLGFNRFFGEQKYAVGTLEVAMRSWMQQ